MLAGVSPTELSNKGLVNTKPRANGESQNEVPSRFLDWLMNLLTAPKDL